MTVMTGDARRALTRLLNAFENHFDIARDGDEADDAALEAAELALRDAFFTYDDILFTHLNVISDVNRVKRALLSYLGKNLPNGRRQRLRVVEQRLQLAQRARTDEGTGDTRIIAHPRKCHVTR